MSTKTKGTALATIAQSAEVLPEIVQLAAIERIDPSTLIGSGDASEIEAKTAELFLSDGYADFEQAWQAINGIFGMKRYAEKAVLAEEGTAFRLVRVVERIGGSYKKEDDWGIEIVTETGEVQVLTLDRNPGRDRWLFIAVAAMKKYNSNSPLCRLDRIEKANGDAFYVIVPALALRRAVQAAVETDVVDAVYSEGGSI